VKPWKTFTRVQYRVLRSVAAVLADGDLNGYPFWVSKVIKVFTENEDVKSVELHRYATNTDPFNGVYKPEMVVDKKMAEREKERV